MEYAALRAHIGALKPSLGVLMSEKLPEPTSVPAYFRHFTTHVFKAGPQTYPLKSQR